MAAGVRVDRAAVTAGAAVAVVVGGLAVALAQAISSFGAVSADLPLYLLLLGGLATGGWVAARRQPRSPLTHGALAAMAGLVVLALLVAGIRLVLGRRQAAPVSLVFQLLMASSAGMFGGYLAARRPPA